MHKPRPNAANPILLTAFSCVLFAPALVSQSTGEGLRAPLVVVQGGTFTVELGPNDSTVVVVLAAGGVAATHSVTPGKQVTLPVPPVPGGTILCLVVGKGAHRRYHVMEVVAPAP
jgi:hypothetical protein